MSYTPPVPITSGITFAQLQSGGLTAALEAVITANLGPNLAPTAAVTLSTSGSSGTLAATTYYVVVTESDGYGETTASPVSSGQAISGTQGILVTYAALQTNNTARNVYVGTASIGPFTLVATGKTTSTTVINSLPTNSYAVNPPTINSTGLTYVGPLGNTINFPLANTRAAEKGNLQVVYNDVAGTIRDWLRGDPIPYNAIIAKIQHAQAAIANINRALTDVGTLVDANPGHFAPTATGIGGSALSRTWP